MNRPPLSNDTIDSVLRHREVGRDKDLSAAPLIGFSGKGRVCGCGFAVDLSEECLFCIRKYRTRMKPNMDSDAWNGANVYDGSDDEPPPPMC